MAVHLSVVTPTAEVIDTDCDQVVVPGLKGELGFLPGHIPLVSALRPGVLTIVNGHKRAHYAVSAGFAEIEDDTITILTDSCEQADAIDDGRAQKALQKSQAHLKTIGPEDAGYGATLRKIERASARLDAKKRVKR